MAVESHMPEVEIRPDGGSEGEWKTGVKACCAVQSQEGCSRAFPGLVYPRRPPSADRSPAGFLLCQPRSLRVDPPPREPQLARGSSLALSGLPLDAPEGRVGFLRIQEREGPLQGHSWAE